MLAPAANDVTLPTPTRPILKWAGGKRQLLPVLLPRIPRTFKNYYEPFFGGGALFFELRPKRAFLNDINLELVNFYSVVRNRASLLEKDLTELIEADGFTEAAYYKVRESLPPTLVGRASRFLYLNKCGFNGLYRTNRAGKYNVPWRRSERPIDFDWPNIRAAARILRGSIFGSTDFEHAVKAAGEGDLVYLDSPYAPVAATSFTAYDKAGFRYSDHVRLQKCVLGLKKRGCHVIVSASDCPAMRQVWKGFEIQTVQARRNVNSKGTARGAIGELVIT